MNNAQTAERIKQLCKSKGVAVTSLLTSCGIRKGLIYDMEKLNKTPSAEILEQIADYFSCSIDYLLGRDNLCKDKAPGTDETAPEDEQEQELIRLARAADPVQRDVALQVLKMAVANERQATCKN